VATIPSRTTGGGTGAGAARRKGHIAAQGIAADARRGRLGLFQPVWTRRPAA
jgi:hypothetical protein